MRISSCLHKQEQCSDDKVFNTRRVHINLSRAKWHRFNCGKRIKRNSTRIAPFSSIWKTTHWNRIHENESKKMKWKIFIISPYWHHLHRHHHHCAWVSFEFLPNIRNSNKKKLLKYEFVWWVNENESRLRDMWISCTSCVACDTLIYEYEFDVRPFLSMRTWKTKWENYYSKPHDENARILYISIIAICWIYIITHRVPRDFPATIFKCAHRHLSFSHDDQSVDQTKHSVLWNRNSAHLPRTIIHEFLLSFDLHTCRWVCVLRAFLRVQAAQQVRLASEINTKSHVWMGSLWAEWCFRCGSHTHS